MLVLSWRGRVVPAAYLAGAPRTDPRTAEELKAEDRDEDRARRLVRADRLLRLPLDLGLGVKSPAQIGPDLSIAVEDMQKRFGVTIDDFLREADWDDVGRACRGRSS